MTHISAAVQPEIIHHDGSFNNPTVGATAEWLPVSPADYRIAYNREAIEESTGSTFGNLRLPAGDSGPDGFPLVVVVHGGAWTSNWGYDYMEPFAESLTRLGLATWNIEYRRPGQTGAEWPAPALDVAQATDFVRTLGQTFPVNLRRVAVAGHSAGGHLAIWLASRHRVPSTSALFVEDPLPVVGAVAMDPWALDMSYDLINKVDSHSDHRSWVSEFLSVSSVEQALEVIEADSISPSQLLPIGVPVELFTGTESFLPTCERYAYASAAEGDPVTLNVMNGAKHFDYPDPWGAAWPTVSSAILAQLSETRTASELEAARPPAPPRPGFGKYQGARVGRHP